MIRGDQVNELFHVSQTEDDHFCALGSDLMTTQDFEAFALLMVSLKHKKRGLLQGVPSFSVCQGLKNLYVYVIVIAKVGILLLTAILQLRYFAFCTLLYSASIHGFAAILGRLRILFT